MGQGPNPIAENFNRARTARTAAEYQDAHTYYTQLRASLELHDNRANPQNDVAEGYITALDAFIYVFELCHPPSGDIDLSTNLDVTYGGFRAAFLNINAGLARRKQLYESGASEDFEGLVLAYRMRGIARSLLARTMTANVALFPKVDQRENTHDLLLAGRWYQRAANDLQFVRDNAPRLEDRVPEECARLGACAARNAALSGNNVAAQMWMDWVNPSQQDVLHAGRAAEFNLEPIMNVGYAAIGHPDFIVHSVIREP